MKLNAELIKSLRGKKAWSQDQLADIAGVSLRTIQRIEKTGIASLESKKAIASAFEMNSTDLDANDNEPDFRDEDEKVYFRVEEGSKLAELVGGAYAYRFNHDNPESEEEADLLASSAQSLQDWGEIWSDLDAGQKIKVTFELSQLIKELETLGFWVFALRTFEEYPGIKGGKWPVASIFLMRSDNPKIIKLNIGEKD
ncbi:helix-turn-helix transcriptional regulator [Thiorhodococcus mannitoliphagus]|uniref:Helix-turn-helix transcriptional regulator n=2 Tax=Thiorhodococcus mannitoliphagus TaxID=329406 RepID=A0A6P1DW89_9GAMM|nr:helix-turn-helix transcriptional regulator [Thiorhodococcus mannitoliphagus]